MARWACWQAVLLSWAAPPELAMGFLCSFVQLHTSLLVKCSCKRFAEDKEQNLVLFAKCWKVWKVECTPALKRFTLAVLNKQNPHWKLRASQQCCIYCAYENTALKLCLCFYSSECWAEQCPGSPAPLSAQAAPGLSAELEEGGCASIAASWHCPCADLQPQQSQGLCLKLLLAIFLLLLYQQQYLYLLYVCRHTQSSTNFHFLIWKTNSMA